MSDVEKAADQIFGEPQKIDAGDVVEGDLISTKKSGAFDVVEDVNPGPKSSYLTMRGGGRLRPRHTTELWVLRGSTPEAASVSDTHAAVMFALQEGAATGGDDDAIIQRACEEFPHADPAEIRAALEQDRGEEVV